jgi:glycosyltransferase involved in cell wall biosynthesis
VTVRVLRVIARLNIGGPAIQAITLTALLDRRGYRTTLVRGTETADEGTMDPLAEKLGVRPLHLPTLHRDPTPDDLRALLQLARIVRRARPAVVHTHAAKGGTLGRVAVLLAGLRPRPVLVHTFHGHSLSGYFAPRTAAVYRRIERFLARRTDRLVAVSDEVRDDLVALGVAPPEKFEVIPLGFDLTPFATDATRAEDRRRVRAELGLGADERVVTLVARLVPIKRVDRFLRVARMLDDVDNVRFVVVGDGELREELHGSEDARALGDRLVWAGWRADMPQVTFASDVVVLVSDNEGTPVSLIEAQASAVPVAATRVGGVASVVADGATGLLAERDDEAGLAAAVRALLADPDRAAAMGAAGRERALDRFSLERLVADVDDLYQRLLADQR